MSNTILSGRNVYTDKKNRTIFYHWYTKKGYILPTDDIPKFYVYKNRFAIVMVGSILLFDYISNWFLIIPAAISLWLAIELYFYRFYFNKMRTVSQQTKLEKRTLLRSIINSKERGKTILKSLLFFAFGILLFVNAYLQEAALSTYVITALVSLGSIYYGVMHLYGFFKSRK